jgi:hypothetical protein
MQASRPYIQSQLYKCYKQPHVPSLNIELFCFVLIITNNTVVGELIEYIFLYVSGVFLTSGDILVDQRTLIYLRKQWVKDGDYFKLVSCCLVQISSLFCLPRSLQTI